MQRIAKKHCITEDDAILSSTSLLHGPVGAVVAGEVYGITDVDILHAIACHTTGEPEMSPLDMVVWLSDKIEPTRTSYPALEEIRSLAQDSLPKALLAALKNSQRHVHNQGKTLHPMTEKTIQWLQSAEERDLK